MRSASLPLALAFLLAAGCGGESGESARSERLSKSEYLERVHALAEGKGGAAARLYGDLVARELPQRRCAEKARQFHRTLEEIVSEIEMLRPPAEVEGLQERFLEEAQASVESVGRAAADVAEGRLQCGQPFNRRVYGLASTERAERVLERFEAKGYVILGD